MKKEIIKNEITFESYLKRISNEEIKNDKYQYNEGWFNKSTKSRKKQAGEIKNLMPDFIKRMVGVFNSQKNKLIEDFKNTKGFLKKAKIILVFVGKIIASFFSNKTLRKIKTGYEKAKTKVKNFFGFESYSLYNEAANDIVRLPNTRYGRITLAQYDVNTESFMVDSSLKIISILKTSRGAITDPGVTEQIWKEIYPSKTITGAQFSWKSRSEWESFARFIESGGSAVEAERERKKSERDTMNTRRSIQTARKVDDIESKVDKAAEANKKRTEVVYKGVKETNDKLDTAEKKEKERTRALYDQADTNTQSILDQIPPRRILIFAAIGFAVLIILGFSAFLYFQARNEQRRIDDRDFQAMIDALKDFQRESDFQTLLKANRDLDVKIDVVQAKVDGVQAKLESGLEEMRKGFSDMDKSIVEKTNIINQKIDDLSQASTDQGNAIMQQIKDGDSDIINKIKDGDKEIIRKLTSAGIKMDKIEELGKDIIEREKFIANGLKFQEQKDQEGWLSSWFSKKGDELALAAEKNFEKASEGTMSPRMPK